MLYYIILFCCNNLPDSKKKYSLEYKISLRYTPGANLYTAAIVCIIGSVLLTIGNDIN